MLDKLAIDEHFKAIKQQFANIIIACNTKISKFYIGIVNPNVLDDITCEYFGQMRHLLEIATIRKAAATNELIVKPYDIKLIPKILTSIEAKSRASVVARVADECIVVSFSQLTTEGKNGLARKLHKIREEFHIEVRNNRHNFVDFLNKNRANISNDLFRNAKETVQVSTKNTIVKIDEAFRKKEAQIYLV